MSLQERAEIILNQPGSEIPGDVIVLAPKPEAGCRCPLKKQYYQDGFTKLFQQSPYHAIEVPLCTVRCECGKVVEYDGTDDGIFMFNKRLAVPLEWLYKAADAMCSSAMTPAAYYASLKDDYCGQYYYGEKRSEDFFSEKIWRDMFFIFICRIGEGVLPHTPVELQEQSRVQQERLEMSGEESTEDESRELLQHPTPSQRAEDSLQQEQSRRQVPFIDLVSDSDSEVELQEEQQQRNAADQEGTSHQEENSEQQQRRETETSQQQQDDSQRQEQQRGGSQQPEESSQQPQQGDVHQQQQPTPSGAPFPPAQQPMAPPPCHLIPKCFCSICKRCPPLMTVDCTYRTIRKNYYFGQSITRKCTGPRIDRKHTRNERCFFNVGDVKKRQQLQTEAVAFGETLIKLSTNPTPPGVTLADLNIASTQEVPSLGGKQRRVRAEGIARVDRDRSHRREAES